MTHPASSLSVDINMAFADLSLDGYLTVPEHAKGLVIFAHGSGSSRFSQRNRFVAEFLNEADLATLLFDLLTPAEEDIDLRTREFRFDIDLLTERLIGVIDWAGRNATTAGFPIGLFGASTGAAAALGAAAEQGARAVDRGR
jgi:putative phosphoribosyl transferase